MQKVITAAEMREVDRLTTEKYGIPSLLLMENAAHAAAGILEKELGGSLRGKTAVILCGRGNNGGDGAALARILWTLGANCFVYLAGELDQTKGDAHTNFTALKAIADIGRNGGEVANHLYFKEISLGDLDAAFAEWREMQADVFVDALFGTGFSGPPKPPLDRIVDFLGGDGLFRRCGLRVSIDIPSGLDSDDGSISGKSAAVDLTVTFTAPKPANVLPPAYRRNGRLVIANIGSPAELVEAQPSRLFLSEREDARKWLKASAFTEDSYKNKRGHAVVIAGSANYSGAAVLAANAAMRSGVGMVTLVTPNSTKEMAASRLCPEVILRGVSETHSGTLAAAAFDEVRESIGAADAVAVGCGIGKHEETREFVEKVVANRQCPMILDADALNILSPFAAGAIEGGAHSPLILTPHEGEFLRLLGAADKQAIEDRVRAVREFSAAQGVILLLKGERVLIGAPDGRVVVNPTGNSGLGKAGNGDTLAGVLAGFAAQSAAMNIDLFDTIVAAVYLAGKAGDIANAKWGRRVMSASDVRECLAEAFAKFSN